MAVSVTFVRRLLLCTLSVLALSACGSDITQSPAATGPSATSVTASAAPHVVPDALAFSAPTVGGGTIDLAQYAGTPLLLWFWAPT